MKKWLREKLICPECLPEEASLDLDIEEEQFDDVRVYRNTQTMPRAWVEDSTGGLRSTTKPVEVIEYTPNRIVVSAEGPGTLVISEIKYPGWWIWGNGVLQAIDSDGKLFRSVDLAPGEQTIRMIYLPISMLLGFLICGMGLIGYVIFMIKTRSEPIK